MKNKYKLFKNRAFISSIIILTGFGLFIAPEANAIGRIIGSLAGTPVDALATGLARIILIFMVIVLENTIGVLFTSLMQFQNFFTDGVNAGWEVSRDFANLFFALALLFIAIATVLSVGPLDNYSYKRMLPSFIFAALFINFSKAIVGVLIDISQIIMIEFYNAIAGAGGVFNSIAAVSNYSSLVTESNSTTNSSFPAFALAIVITAILAMVLAWTALVLVIRIVTLWLVIMTAPLAFVSFIIPPMRGIWKEWSSKLQSSLVVGPSLMFFLYLSLRVFEGATIGSTFDPFNYALVIVLILASNKYALDSANAAPAFAKKAAAFVGGAAVGAATLGLWHRKELGQAKDAVVGAADKGIRRTAKTIDVAGSIAGKDPLLAEKYDVWKENAAASNASGKGRFGQFGQEVFGGPAGKAKMTETARTWQAVNAERADGKPLTPEQRRVLAAKESEYINEFKNLDDVSMLVEKFKNGDQLQKTAALKVILDNGDLDELLNDPEYKDKYVAPYATTAASVAALIQNDLNINQKNATDYDQNLLAGLEKKYPELKGIKRIISSKESDDTSSPKNINSVFNNNITFDSFAQEDTESAVGKLKLNMLQTRQLDTESNQYTNQKVFSLNKLNTFMDTMQIDDNLAANPSTWKKLKVDARREMEKALEKAIQANPNNERYKAVLQGIQGKKANTTPSNPSESDLNNSRTSSVLVNEDGTPLQY